MQQFKHPINIGHLMLHFFLIINKYHLPITPKHDKDDELLYAHPIMKRMKHVQNVFQRNPFNSLKIRAFIGIRAF